jgi:hypothetical protein
MSIFEIIDIVSVIGVFKNLPISKNLIPLSVIMMCECPALLAGSPSPTPSAFSSKTPPSNTCYYHYISYGKLKKQEENDGTAKFKLQTLPVMLIDEIYEGIRADQQ